MTNTASMIGAPRAVIPRPGLAKTAFDAGLDCAGHCGRDLAQVRDLGSGWWGGLMEHSYLIPRDGLVRQGRVQRSRPGDLPMDRGETSDVSRRDRRCRQDVEL